MKIKDIYVKYEIPAFLQQHLYRVASVGDFISRNMNLNSDTKSIVSSLLLHDVAKIYTIKFDYVFESSQPEGVKYWMEIQDKIRKKYKSEHNYLDSILKELGVKNPIYNLVMSTGFAKSDCVFNSGSIDKMICCYSDMRVGFWGVLPLEYRLREGRLHYRINNNITDNSDYDSWNYFYGYQKKIEQKIFENCKITEDMVTDKAIKNIMDEIFQNYEI